MMPASSDPFPRDIAIVRGNRRSVELSLEEGRLLARVPRRMSPARLDPLLKQLRQQLWNRLRREYVFDNESLVERARAVAEGVLGDQNLPPFTVRFSLRQRKRWGSCTSDGKGGTIRISSRLIGHPCWVLDHLLLHELAHLRHANHGHSFQALIQRSPDHDRGRGYHEALESVERLGPTGSVSLEWSSEADEAAPQLPLFHPRSRSAEN